MKFLFCIFCVFFLVMNGFALLNHNYHISKHASSLKNKSLLSNEILFSNFLSTSNKSIFCKRFNTSQRSKAIRMTLTSPKAYSPDKAVEKILGEKSNI
jgi:hypothetical protein